MPHSIDHQGKVIVTLEDYNYLNSVKYRDRIKNFCEPLQGIGNTKYFSLFINFADGKKFSISNMPLWSVAYHTLGYFRADADRNPSVYFTQNYFIHSLVRYDALQNVILSDLMNLYKIFPTFALVRKCLECEIIAEAYHEIYLENPLFFYHKYQKLFEKFCINFINKILDILLIKLPEHRFDKFIVDPNYRLQVLRGKNSDFLLTQREKECILWASYGKTSEETSAILKISKRTVETYINNAKYKLDCTNMAHLVAKCVKYQLLNKE